MPAQKYIGTMQINRNTHVVLSEGDGERIWSKREREERRNAGSEELNGGGAVQIRLSQTKPGSGYCIRSDPASDARRLSAFYILYLYSCAFLTWEMFLCEESKSQLFWWLVYTRFSVQRYISRPTATTSPGTLSA